MMGVGYQAVNGLPSPALEPPPIGVERAVRFCAVCGDSPAKLHYGVLACFGCKGFFRRAVKEGRNKYVCRYEKHCKVDKYERNSCRYCRFRKCLQVGMNPDSVRPDRIESNRTTKPKGTQSLLSDPSTSALPQSLISTPGAIKAVHSSSHFRLSRQDSSRGVPSVSTTDSDDDFCSKSMTDGQRELLSSIVKLESRCQRECHSQSPESVRDFTLKSLINERILATADDQSPTLRAVHHFDGIRADSSIFALWRIVACVDWVNGLCGIAVATDPMETITVEDKVAIVQCVYSRFLVFRICAQHVADAETISDADEDLSVLRSLIDSDDSAQTCAVTEDVIRPLKRCGAQRAELLLLQAILTVDPSIKGIRPAASDLLHEFRSRLQDTLANHLRPQRGSVFAAFGNFLLLMPSIVAIAERLNESLRFKFPCGELGDKEMPHVAILRSIAHPDTTDYLRFPQLNRKLFAQSDKRPSMSSGPSSVVPTEMSRDQTPPSVLMGAAAAAHSMSHAAAYSNWQTFATAFGGIPVGCYSTSAECFQVPGYNPSPHNFSLVSALSPNGPNCTPLYSTNLFPGQPLPDSAPSVINVLPPTSQPPPPLTITAPTPPPVCATSQFAFHTPPSEPDARLPNDSIPTPTSRPNQLEIPDTSACSSKIIPKLPLQLTKSIEEMLRPAGVLPDDPNVWNKPLSMDWADLKVSTPAFNRDVVAKFFPECASNAQQM